MYSYQLVWEGPISSTFKTNFGDEWAGGHIAVFETDDRRKIQSHRLMIKHEDWSMFDKFLKAFRSEEVHSYTELTDGFYKETKRRVVNFNFRYGDCK